ncbi:hypothetical protein Btru_075513 [Bulinus truncatus]|nr:hypothetical protein Btru_075513 [Bulinus truncatus]
MSPLLRTDNPTKWTHALIAHASEVIPDNGQSYKMDPCTDCTCIRGHPRSVAYDGLVYSSTTAGTHDGLVYSSTTAGTHDGLVYSSTTAGTHDGLFIAAQQQGPMMV